MRLIDWAHRIDLSTETQEVYLHRFLFQLALGTVAIFIPLYILDHGFALRMVFRFYIIFYATFIVLAWPAANLAARLGYKHTSLLAAPILLVFYLTLRSLATSPILLDVAAAVGGIGFITYWIGMNSEMARASHDGRQEEETGYFFSMPMIASVIAPLLGGMVIALYSFNLLFVLAAILIAASFLPFLFSNEHYSGMEISPRTFLHRDHITDFLALVMQGTVSIGRKVLWPLYLAVVITESVTIGGAGSLLALGAALTSIMIGRVTNQHNNGRVMRIGAVVAAAAYLAMAQVTTPAHALTISFLAGTAYVTVSLPLYSRVIRTAEAEDILEYFTFREIALCTGRTLTLLLFAAIFTLFPRTSAFLLGFIFTAAAILFTAVFGTHLGLQHEQ